MSIFRPIKQEDSFGCSVACIASLLGITYKEAKKLFAKPQNAKKIGFYCEDIVSALGNEYIWTTNLYYLKEGAIVFVDYCKKFPNGHWMIFINDNKYMDSWINYPSYPIEAGYATSIPSNITHIIYKQTQG